MSNTGNKVFLNLEERRVDNNQPTGFTKPNIISDPDYIPPVIDLISCTPEQITTTTTLPIGCGGLFFSNVGYVGVETDSGGIGFWNLPINMSQLTSIVSWEVRIQTSQSCRAPNGFIVTQLNSYDVTAFGSNELTPLGLTGSSGSWNLMGNLFNGSFAFPSGGLAVSSPPPPTPSCSNLNNKVWQNQTTVTIIINYIDLCNQSKVFNQQYFIPQYRVTDASNTFFQVGCLEKHTNILLANNDEKLIENIVTGDMLRGIKLKKEQCHYDTFKDSLFIHVEVEKVDRFIVDRLLKIDGLSMSLTHKHVVLRKETLFVVAASEIKVGDKIYDFDKMTFCEIKNIEILTGQFEVFNIELKGDYKYYFANNQLTHNKIVNL